MHLSEILKAELTAFAKRAKKKGLDIVETGTIRGDGENYQRNDGWSTLTFAEWAKKNGGSVTSIDLDTSTAERVLEARGLLAPVKLIESHSITALASIVRYDGLREGEGGEGGIDVAFLDSDNDASLIFHEYLIVRHAMRSPGLIIVDDVDIESTEVVKGHEILPWAKANEIPFRIVERSGDYRIGVMVFEV